MSSTPDLEDRVAALEAAVTALTQPEPDFMDRTRVETLRGTEVLNVRLLHEPTGITVTARDQQEAVHKLRKALAAEARHQAGIQEAERREQAKTAREAAEADLPHP